MFKSMRIIYKYHNTLLTYLDTETMYCDTIDAENIGDLNYGYI